MRNSLHLLEGALAPASRQRVGAHNPERGWTAEELVQKIAHWLFSAAGSE
jgi:hypothetical protein